MPYTGTLDASKPTVFPHGIQAVVVGSAGAQQGAIVSLTDSSGGSANDTIAAITNAANAGSADVGPTADAIADLAAKVEEILDALRGAGIIAT